MKHVNNFSKTGENWSGVVKTGVPFGGPHYIPRAVNPEAKALKLEIEALNIEYRI